MAPSGLPAQHPAPLQSRDLKPVHSWMGLSFADLGHRKGVRSAPCRDRFLALPNPHLALPNPHLALPDSHRACRTRTSPRRNRPSGCRDGPFPSRVGLHHPAKARQSATAFNHAALTTFPRQIQGHWHARLGQAPEHGNRLGHIAHESTAKSRGNQDAGPPSSVTTATRAHSHPAHSHAAHSRSDYPARSPSLTASQSRSSRSRSVPGIARPR